VDGTSTFFASDHLGSITQQTNSAGQVTLARSYEPWGKIGLRMALGATTHNILMSFSLPFSSLPLR
jgi:hypothetical protein